MLETIVVSALVSALTARVSAKIFLGSIDKYTDDLLRLVKEFLLDMVAILNKRI